MKKLLFSSFTALMMLFSMVGFVRAEEGESETTPAQVDTVTVTLSSATWKMGSSSTQNPRFLTEIKLVEGSTLAMGSTEDKLGVLVTLSKDGSSVQRVLTAANQALLNDETAQLNVVGDWDVTYQLVKGNSTVSDVKELDESIAVALSSASSSTLTVQKGQVAAPRFSEYAGAVDAGTAVTITTTTLDAVIYYTTDGEDPTTSSTEYTTPVIVNEAMTIKAMAVKEGWDNSTISSVEYTIATLPADAEGAPEITLDPADADSVDNNTEIFITAPAGYKVYYISCATLGEAVSILETVSSMPSTYLGYMLTSYGMNIPTVTDRDPVLVVVLVGDETYTYCRRYKVRKGSEVEMPAFTTVGGAQSGVVAKGTELNIYLQEEELDIWYTTDGSKPVVDGATSTKGEDKGIAKIKIDSSMTVRAIAVTDDGQASDVAVTRFKIYEDVVSTLVVDESMVVVKGDTVGKNVALPFSIESADLGNEIQYLLYEHPFTVYYTTDGTTEPSEDEYYELKAKDSANNPIKMASSETDEWGDIIMPSVLLSESPVTLKAKGYLMLGETTEEGMLVTSTLTKTFVLEEEQRPGFSILPGSEIKAGDTLTVKNPGTEELASTIYFSFNGTQPSQSAYDKQEYGEEWSVFKTNEGEDLKIIFGKDAKGMYAQVPAIFELLYKQDTIRFEEEFSVEVICYSMVETGKYNMMGRPEMFQYGSDFVKASYTEMNDLPKPVITPNGGAVAKGTKVEISSEYPVYYSINADTVNANSTLYVAADGIIIDKDSITVRAIAIKKTEEGEADSVSNIAEAFFTIKADTLPAPKFSEVAGQVEKGTKVRITCDTADADIYYTVNGGDPTTASIRYEAEISIDSNMTIKAIAVKEGFVTSEVATAAYTVKADEPTDTVEAPVFSLSGEVEEGDTLKITCATEGAEIYCALGEAAFAKYTAGIVITEDVTVRAYAVKGETYSDTVSVTLTVKKESAVEGRELAGVRLYPNPTDGNFSVESPVAAKVEIFSANGVIVKSFTMAAGVEEVRLANSGIYFVRLTAENGQSAVRRVIVR